MSDIELLKNVPDSYEDFVNCLTRWMDRDPEIKNRILDQLNSNPDSSTSEILKILCDYLGIGEPLELLDDDSPVSVEDIQEAV